MKRWGAWLIVLAVAAYGASVALANARGNLLITVVGEFVALALTAPLWWQRPRYLLVALVLFLPFQDAIAAPQQHGTTLVRTLPDALVMAAFVARAALALWRRERFFGTPLDLPLILLLVVSAISTLLNHIGPSQAIGGVYTFLRYAAVFYLVAASGFNASEARGIVRALVWVGFIQCAIGVAQFLVANTGGGSVFGYSLVQGTTSHSNVLAVYLALLCVLALATYSDAFGKWARFELAAFVGLSLAVMILALDRQGIVALILGVATVAVVLRWQKRVQSSLIQTRQVLVGGSAGVLLGLLSVTQGIRILPRVWTQLAGSTPSTAPSSSLGTPSSTPTTGAAGTGAGSSSAYDSIQAEKAKQLAQPGYYLSTSSSRGRLYEILNGAPQILHDAPFFGFGPGTFGNQATFSDYKFYIRLHVGSLVASANENYLSDVGWMNVFGQLGLLGVAGFLWIFWGIGQIGYRALTKMRDDITGHLGVTCLALIPMFLFVCWFGPNLELRPIAVLLWFIPGLTLSLLRHEAREAETSVRDESNYTGLRARIHV